MVCVSPVVRMSTVGTMSAISPLRRRLAQSAADLSLRAALQQAAVHVGGAARHGRPGVDVLLHGVLGETFGRQHRHLAGVHVGLRGDAQHAAEMVHVAVGVDHRDDGPVAAVRAVQLQRRGRHLGGDQRVDDDQTGVALDEADVGEVQAADLVDARHHLVETLLGGQHALPPQAGMHRWRRVAGDERVRVVIPHHPPVGGFDDAGRQRRDESPVGVGEIGGVVERQRVILVCGFDDAVGGFWSTGPSFAAPNQNQPIGKPAGKYPLKRDEAGSTGRPIFAEFAIRAFGKAAYCRNGPSKCRRTATTTKEHG